MVSTMTRRRVLPAAAHRSLAGRTPATLWVLMGALVLLSLASGALSGWAVSQHSDAAASVAAVHEPLSLDAQQMYEAVADADVTITGSLLANQQPPQDRLQRYRTDIAEAAASLAKLQDAGGNPQLTAAITAFSTGLPLYTGYVAQAQDLYALGYPLTGGSFLQVASEEAHLTLLPAAKTIYAQQNAATSAASDQATGLPTVVIALVLALAAGFALYRAQRWLARRTNRIFNYGLVGASIALIVSVLWLAVTFAVARSDLDTGLGQGARPAEALAQANIDVQQIRGDAILNVISRSGSTSFETNFNTAKAEIGLLLSSAAGNARTAPYLAAAQRDARAWYTANEQVYRLGASAQYQAEREMVIGTGPGRSAAGYNKLERDISQALAVSQQTFRSGANSGAGAFGPLEGVVIAASLLIAASSAWGLSRRIAEYR